MKEENQWDGSHLHGFQLVADLLLDLLEFHHFLFRGLPSALINVVDVSFYPDVPAASEILFRFASARLFINSWSESTLLHIFYCLLLPVEDSLDELILLPDVIALEKVIRNPIEIPLALASQHGLECALLIQQGLSNFVFVLDILHLLHTLSVEELPDGLIVGPFGLLSCCG